MPVKDFLNGIPCMLVYNGFMIAGDNDTLLNRDIASCLLFKMLFIIFLHPKIPFIKRIAENTENRFLFPVISVIILNQKFSKILLLIIGWLRNLLLIKDFPDFIIPIAFQSKLENITDCRRCLFIRNQMVLVYRVFLVAEGGEASGKLPGLGLCQIGRMDFLAYIPAIHLVEQVLLGKGTKSFEKARIYAGLRWIGS